jgi:hypothetical protein
MTATARCRSAIGSRERLAGCREPDDGCLCRSYAYTGRNPRYQPILGGQCGLMGTVVAMVHRI